MAFLTHHETVPPAQADVLIVLGGDGFMLETMHRYMFNPVSFYGMNCGSVGFLLNQLRNQDLGLVLSQAQEVQLHPLLMRTFDAQGQTAVAYAINEVSVFRETRQAAKIRIQIDDITRLEEVICDGVLVATPAGSTAYNLSAHGVILPLGAPLLALTPLNPFRPRRWRGALLPESAKIQLELLEPQKRPVLAAADFTEIRDVTRVEISTCKDVVLRVLFDPDHNLEERILREQFMV